MSDDINKKLKRVLDDAFATDPSGEVWLVEPIIERIKQVFKDARWLPPADTSVFEKAMVDAYLKAGGDPDLMIMSRTDWNRNRKLAGVMTGQEWYDRFWKEYELPEGRNPKFIDSTTVRKDIDVIACRAAGIDSGGE